MRMSYMRVTDPEGWYIYGDISGNMVFYGPEWHKGFNSAHVPFDVIDQFVVMRFSELPRSERRRLSKKAFKQHGRPMPWWYRLTLRRPLRWTPIWHLFDDADE